MKKLPQVLDSNSYRKWQMVALGIISRVTLCHFLYEVLAHKDIKKKSPIPPTNFQALYENLALSTQKAGGVTFVSIRSTCSETAVSIVGGCLACNLSALCDWTQHPLTTILWLPSLAAIMSCHLLCVYLLSILFLAEQITQEIFLTHLLFTNRVEHTSWRLSDVFFCIWSLNFIYRC